MAMSTSVHKCSVMDNKKTTIPDFSDIDFISFLYSERDRENSLSQYHGWNSREGKRGGENLSAYMLANYANVLCIILSLRIIL